MKTVYKYELLRHNPAIKMPKDAQVLTVQIQNGVPCLWALVEEENEFEDRHFEIFGTGHPIDFQDNELIYIATYQTNQLWGDLVFHVFEKLIK